MGLYFTRNRPVGPGTIPKGLSWAWVELPGCADCRPMGRKLPISQRPYGVFRTERALTASELADYEISEHTKATGQ